MTPGFEADSERLQRNADRLCADPPLLAALGRIPSSSRTIVVLHLREYQRAAGGGRTKLWSAPPIFPQGLRQIVRSGAYLKAQRTWSNTIQPAESGARRLRLGHQG